MDLAYNIFFTLQVTLGGTTNTSFVFAPDATCQASFSQHDLLFVPRTGYFFVAATTILNTQNVSIVPYPLTGITRFTFLMTLSTVGTFMADVDLQLTGQDTSRIGRGFYYFNNLDATGKPDGAATGNALTLSKQSLVSVADLWSVIPSSYSFQVNPAQYTEVQLFEVNAEAPLLQLPSVFTTGAPVAKFNLNGNPAGPYLMKWIGTPARQEFVYADPALAPATFFALVEIYKDSSANTVLLNGPPITYTIPFKSL